ncbi:MAG TPA: hypothetical protein VNN74_05090 [Candidatus Micrarchaeia archaeon]|nr:hypothetical protein [Candidatus Micrarchaeia archaeon]
MPGPEAVIRRATHLLRGRAQHPDPVGRSVDLVLHLVHRQSRRVAGWLDRLADATAPAAPKGTRAGARAASPAGDASGRPGGRRVRPPSDPAGPSARAAAPRQPPGRATGRPRARTDPD